MLYFMASSQPTFAQQVLAAGTQFLGDVGGRTAVWLTPKIIFQVPLELEKDDNRSRNKPLPMLGGSSLQPN